MSTKLPSLEKLWVLPTRGKKAEGLFPLIPAYFWFPQNYCLFPLIPAYFSAYFDFLGLSLEKGGKSSGFTRENRAPKAPEEIFFVRFRPHVFRLCVQILSHFVQNLLKSCQNMVIFVIFPLICKKDVYFWWILVKNVLICGNWCQNGFPLWFFLSKSFSSHFPYIVLILALILALI